MKTSSRVLFTMKITPEKVLFGHLVMSISFQKKKKSLQEEKLIKKTEQTELLLEQTEVLLEQKRQEVEQTRQEAEQTRQEEHQKLLKGIENLLRRGDTIESIADLLVRSVEEITAFVAQIETKKY